MVRLNVHDLIETMQNYLPTYLIFVLIRIYEDGMEFCWPWEELITFVLYFLFSFLFFFSQDSYLNLHCVKCTFMITSIMLMGYNFCLDGVALHIIFGENVHSHQATGSVKSVFTLRIYEASVLKNTFMFIQIIFLFVLIYSFSFLNCMPSVTGMICLIVFMIFCEHSFYWFIC